MVSMSEDIVSYITLDTVKSAPFVVFYSNKDGKEVECGRLDIVNGVLTFEGNADESAKSFFEALSYQFSLGTCRHEQKD